MKIILVHGIASKRFWMTFLGRKLKRFGYDIETWGYNSCVGDLQRHSTRLSEHLSQQARPFHLVAHSMGSIVSRLAIRSSLPSFLKRVVLLAPPNQGSPVATLLSPLTHWICPALTQMSHRPNSFVNSLTHSGNFEIGIIAARFDTLVPLGNTQLGNQTDHIILGATHNSLLFQSNVARHVSRFLTSGTFDNSTV